MPLIDQLYVACGVSVLLLSLAAGPIKERLWLSEPLLALLIGFAIGPGGLGLVDLSRLPDSRQLLERAARLTVSLSVMGVALRLPTGYLRAHVRSVAVMLAVVMPLMWLLASAAAYLVFGGSLLMALWIGAVMTPTDPVLADAIVTGSLAEASIDPELRHLLSAESAANDGLAFLLVMLPVSALKYGWAQVPSRWLLQVAVREVLLAMVLGALVGWLVGELSRRLLAREIAAGPPRLAVVTALALAVLGSARLLHTDGLVAVFAAGVALNHALGDSLTDRQHEVQEVITRFFDTPIFILFGMLAPLSEWRALGAPGVIFAALVLLGRRLPVVLAVRRWLRPVDSLRKAAFAGWFGPIGAAALVYSTWARNHEHNHRVWVIGSLVVAASVIVHGITATPFTRWYGRSRREV